MAKKRLLIIDDARCILEYLVSKFSHKYDVLIAHSGKEGIAILEKEDVDAVITDYIMPGVNGLQVLDAIKEKCSSLPAVLMTAFGNNDLRKNVEKRGAKYLSKPFDINMLEELLEEMINANDI